MNIYIQILLQILRAIIFYDLDLLSEILWANLQIFTARICNFKGKFTVLLKFMHLFSYCLSFVQINEFLFF